MPVAPGRAPAAGVSIFGPSPSIRSHRFLHTVGILKAALRHLPNLLSGLRIGLAALFPFLSPTGRIVVCIAAAVSDVLDGWIARHFDLDSPYGNTVDPVADKIFVLAVFTVLLLEEAIAPWELLAIAVRDIAVVARSAALLLMGRNETFAQLTARLVGKITTVLQFSVLFVVLIWQQLPLLLVLATALVSTAAAVDYSVDFVRRVRRAEATD